MSKNSMILIAALAGVLLMGGGALAYTNSQSNKNRTEQTAMTRQEADSLAMKKENEVEAMKQDNTGDAMAKQGDAANNAAAMAKGSYTTYDQAKLANAESGKVVLFFHAPWCPTCKEANKNFEASTAPNGLTLLKVDYDSSNDLKKKYGVTYQHTFVQVDKDGNLLKKWNGSNGYDDIKAEEI